MKRAIQKRTLETRARLIAAAEEIVARDGYEALRVEEVVLRAGVAKGTFFAHFRDKDVLMERLIGPKIDAELDRIAALPTPRTVEELVTALLPLIQVMTAERYVFDVVFRYSGAAAIEEVGAVAATFARFIEVMADRLADGPFRRDLTPELLADGVHAFVLHAMAAKFCALAGQTPLEERLAGYLRAWLLPAA
ncbi:MAG: TetR/AcrR family transcriptional regulator [Pseudomonadota bacterium]